MELKPKMTKANLNISDQVIADIVKAVVADIDGVASLGNAPISFKTVAAPGAVSLSTEEEVAMMDVYVVLDTNCNIQRTAETIQKNVKDMVQDMTGITVSRINVHVQDVAVNS